MTRVSRLLAAALLATGLAAPEDRQAPVRGAIRGRVEVPELTAPIARRPTVTELGMPMLRLSPHRRPSVVYLESAPRGAFEQPPARHAVLDQRDETFVPHVLAVTVGTAVEFPNSDATYHNVFSLSRTRPFDLGRYPTGRSKSVRFDRPGVVRVFCDIHSHMSAFILVFAHSHFTVTDGDDHFRIEDVPPGQYRVLVWHEAFEDEERAVTVPAEGGDVEVNFSLGSAGRRSEAR